MQNSTQSRQASAVAAILCGGLLAATFDLAFAVIFNYLRSGVTPVQIFQTIASGWLGKSAFEDGSVVAALGIASHYCILLVAAAVYYAASRKLDFLARHPLLWGPMYGIAIYGFMHLVVLPLSAAPVFKPSLVAALSDLASHMFLVGWSIAFAARRFSGFGAT